MATMGVSRTTADSAAYIGSLFGAGLFAAVRDDAGLCAITAFYGIGFLLTLGVAAAQVAPLRAIRSRPSGATSKEGLAYVWDTPCSLAAMWLAFLVNMTAFPMTSGLLPYVAKDIYHMDQTGLGTLVASFAFG